MDTMDSLRLLRHSILLQLPLFLLLMLLLVQTCGGVQASSCPKDALGAVHACVGIKKEFDGGGSGLISDTNKMKQICQDVALEKAIRCLERVVGACASETTLEQTINARKWKWGMRTLCENLPELMRSESCLVRTQPIMEQCGDNQTESYNMEVRNRVLVGNHEPDVIMRLSCNYTDNIINCIKRPMERYCSPRVVRIMMQVVHSFIPPACHVGDEAFYTDSSHSNHRTWTMTSSLFSCLSLVLLFHHAL